MGCKTFMLISPLALLSQTLQSETANTFTIGKVQVQHSEILEIFIKLLLLAAEPLRMRSMQRAETNGS